MKELKVNLWNLYDQNKICGITTNGYVKKNGLAVMGRGCALQARKRFMGLPRVLGNKIKSNGNIVQIIEHNLFAFPTKTVSGTYSDDIVVPHMVGKFRPGEWVPGWALKSTIAKISLSIEQLIRLKNTEGWNEVFLPRPGCGAGGLDWHNEIFPLFKDLGDWLCIVEKYK